MPQSEQIRIYLDDALRLHPDCAYADWANGLNMRLQRTIVVNLWRNEECHRAGDPPRYVEEGYPYAAD